MLTARSLLGCAIFQSPIHSGRSVVIAAGGLTDDGSDTAKAEIWDFTLNKNSWEKSMHTHIYLACNHEKISLFFQSMIFQEAWSVLVWYLLTMAKGCTCFIGIISMSLSAQPQIANGIANNKKPNSVGMVMWQCAYQLTMPIAIKYSLPKSFKKPKPTIKIQKQEKMISRIAAAT